MKLSASFVLVLSAASVCGVAHGQTVGAPSTSPWPVVDDASRTAAARGRTAFWHSLGGTLAPMAAGAAFSMVAQPGGKNDVPAWQWGTMAVLFGLGGTWGPSLGYYQGGLTTYATLAGVGKSAMLAGAIYLDRHSESAMPALTILALSGVVAWDTFDLITVSRRVRKHHEAEATALVPVAMPTQGGGVIGAAGTF